MDRLHSWASGSGLRFKLQAYDFKSTGAVPVAWGDVAGLQLQLFALCCMRTYAMLLA